MEQAGYSLDDIPLWKSFDTESLVVPEIHTPDVVIPPTVRHEETTSSDDLVDTTEEESSDVGWVSIYIFF